MLAEMRCEGGFAGEGPEDWVRARAAPGKEGDEAARDEETEEAAAEIKDAAMGVGKEGDEEEARAVDADTENIK